MNVLRSAWIEAKALHRVLGMWLLGFLLAWLLLIRLQEPAFFRRRGVPFYWASTEALLTLGLALLPLIGRLAQGGSATAWAVRCSSAHMVRILSSCLSTVGYGVFVTAVTAAFAFALDSIAGGPRDWRPTLHLAGACLPPLLILAAVAPGFALLTMGRTQMIFVWLVAAALVLHFLWPGPVVDKPLVGLLSVLQATAAGLLLSLAATLHRVRPWPARPASHAHRHPR